MSVSIGNLTIAAGQNKIFTAPREGQKAILIGNESGLTCTITMEGSGIQKTLYPSTLDWFPVRPGFTGNILISPSAVLNNTSQWPSSTLIFDAIGIGDIEDSRQYPIQLTRLSNVGNTVTTAMGGSTTLQNDNNADDTQVIEMQVTGSPQSTGRWGNNGNFFIKQYISGVLTTLFQVIENAATCVLLGATGKTTEIVGSLTVDQNATITGTSTHTGAATFNGAGTGVSVAHNLSVSGSSSLDNGSITTDGSGNVTMPNNRAINLTLNGGGTTVGLQALSSNDVIVQCASGKIVHINDGSGEALQVANSGVTITPLLTLPNGLILSGGTVSFLTGSISRVSKFTGAQNGNGATTYNHGLGATPDFVIVMPNLSGNPSVTIALGPDMAGATSTQVTVRSKTSDGATNYNIVGLAIKF